MFDNGIAQFIHLNDPMSKWIFYSRFSWFISEMQDWLFLCFGKRDKSMMILNTSTCVLVNKPNFWSRSITGGASGLVKKAGTEYYESHEKQRVADSIREPSPHELEEEEERIERENAEEEAKNVV